MTHPTAAEPATLLAELARPTRAYRMRVWLAAAALAVFLVAYLLLAGWFLRTAFRLKVGAGASDFEGFLTGICSFILAIFMIKALFFHKRSDLSTLLEVTRADQPRLFEFLDRIAAEAKAPRPRKVYVSPRLNASVFYDLSPANLILPAQKNLEIGLPLVNSLSLGEFRAVLAHEFGHFSQGSMALLRWSYIAQQIAGQLVARRDKLDDLIRGIMRVDLRIAWIGFILSLIIWSIRSVVDTAFQAVYQLQLALSREMEFHADLVAVSVTGSDALIHALHRLRAGDECWDRTLAFLDMQLQRDHRPRDAFSIQARLLESIGRIVGDPTFGRVPPVPAEHPGEHRVFTPDIAQPPQMWLSHPLNHDREANAKRRYVPAAIDGRSAWEIFDATRELREQLTAKLISAEGKALAAEEESVAELERELGREAYAARYRGLYLAHSPVRGAWRVEELTGPTTLGWRDAMPSLYPPSIAEDVTRLRVLMSERAQLKAVSDGNLTGTAGVIRHRGRTISKRDLPDVIAAVGSEILAVEERLRVQDLATRSLHLAAAKELGAGWPEYLSATLAALHYAEHVEADLADAASALTHIVRFATIARRVDDQKRETIRAAASHLHQRLLLVHQQGAAIELAAPLLERLRITSWKDALGEFTLPSPEQANLGQWLSVFESWVRQPLMALARLRGAALDELLRSEAYVADCAHEGAAPIAAPTPSRLPSSYPALLPGAERKRDRTISVIDRFLAAHGAVPAIARFAVAGGIVASVLLMGATSVKATVYMYNGLGRAVRVRLGETDQILPAASRRDIELVPGSYQVVTTTEYGAPIERFPVEIPTSAPNLAYNVAGATPLLEYRVSYGPTSLPSPPPDHIGAPRWRSTAADVFFEDAPSRIQASAGASKLVLGGFADTAPRLQLRLLRSKADSIQVLRAHARWDPADTKNGASWLYEARAELSDFNDILRARLARSPDDVVLLRLEQDTPDSAAREAACARHAALAKASPDNAHFAYLVARCLTAGAGGNAAMFAGHRRWPHDPWFLYGAGYGWAESEQLERGLTALDSARQALPAIADRAAVDEARILRLIGEGEGARMDRLAEASGRVRNLRLADIGRDADSSIDSAYAALAAGRLADALAPSDIPPRLVRLVGASDGANKAEVAAALALAPDSGLDGATLWPSVALAVREGRDYSALLAAANIHQSAPPTMLRFLEIVHHGGSKVAAERVVSELDLERRAQAYVIGIVLLGDRAPAEWRRRAKRLLFVPERPFIR